MIEELWPYPQSQDLPHIPTAHILTKHLLQYDSRYRTLTDYLNHFWLKFQPIKYKENHFKMAAIRYDTLGRVGIKKIKPPFFFFKQAQRYRSERVSNLNTVADNAQGHRYRKNQV